MEQYIHTLISIDPEFAPKPAQVASFFSELVSEHRFNLITGQRWLPGLVVTKPTGKFQERANPMTGEKMLVPERDRLNLEKFGDIPAVIQDVPHYTVSQSGQWAAQDRPVDLLQTNGVLFEENYVCTVRCELRPEPVSTSAWDLEAGPNTRNVPAFGSECNNPVSNGIFPNPWTGEVIEVANAGCARFWIEFEFGKFVYPKITNGLQVMSPAIASGAERRFETGFAQGCRFW